MKAVLSLRKALAEETSGAGLIASAAQALTLINTAHTAGVWDGSDPLDLGWAPADAD